MRNSNKSITEKILRPRLKVLGYILLTLALCSLVYAISIPFISYDPVLNPPSTLSKVEPYLEIEDFVPHELLNFYAVAGLFSFLSFICFWTSIKRKKKR